MRRSSFASALAILASSSVLAAAPQAQPPSPLGGIWTLNRGASEFPAELGFNPAWATTPPPEGRGMSGGSGGGGRGRRGSSSSGGDTRGTSPFSPRAESYEDARRVQLVTSNARNPPVRLVIVDTPYAVTITNELGQSRTLHTDGKEETVEIEGTLFGVTSRRDGDELISTYRVGANREIRYTYSVTPDPKRLIIDVQFLEKGNGDKARRIYDAGTDPRPTEAVAATPERPGSGAPGAPGAPGGTAPAKESFDQRPGAELRGLTNIGMVVENLSGQATACGLNQQTIETALAKKLTDAGFTVKRNSDEDTYVYVNVMTSSVANGVCVSRYDAFLYTQGTAKLSYHDQPVLVQVSLMHRGGIGTSAPSAHPAAVTRGLEGFMDLFATQIRDANK
jgi:hypothetical protein